MKRYFFLAISTLIGLVMLAQQTQMNFHLSIGSIVSFPISDIDTIRFHNGVISIEGVNTEYDILDVDSATFTQSEAGDTVFVTYNGNSVTVDNPYPSISVEQEGANVALRSSADMKGVVYYLSGSSSEGSFSLVPDRGYTLVLDNLSLTANHSAAITLNASETGDSYTAALHLIGNSTLTDSDQNGTKAAFYTKSKLKINEDGSAGKLTVTGNKKHAINSSKRIELYAGELAVEGAVSDGINADGLEVYGGLLSVSGTSGDGVDCSEVILVEDGEVHVEIASEDKKALKCDSIVKIAGGVVEAEVSGAGSKAIKGGKALLINDGNVTVKLSATEAFYNEEEADYSYNAALSSNELIEIANPAKVTVTGDGIASKALLCDSVIHLLGGEIVVEMNGADHIGTVNGVADTAVTCGIKAKREINITEGSLFITLGEKCNASKGLKADYVNISGGNVRVTDNGGYYYTTSTISSNGSNNPWGGGGGRPGGGGGPGGSFGGSTTTVNSTEPKGIRGDVEVTITGGTTVLFIAHGKGISCDELITIGKEGGSAGDLILTINAGTEKDETFSKGGENSRSKFYCSPKAIKCGNSVIINSGTLDIVSYDTGVKGNDVTVNGGKISITASYDQGMHGVQNFTINNGNILVSKSYEAFEGVTMTFNGGITSVFASNDGWNVSTSSSGKGTPTLTVNGGFHYLNVNGNDTDVIDSNGSISFQGGVVVCESNGNTLDCDESPAWNSKAQLLLFGSKSETIPANSTSSSYSSISSGTRYSTVNNNEVLLSFTTTQTASKLIYVGSVRPKAYVGGTVTAPTQEVEFRQSDGSKAVLSIGGNIGESQSSSDMAAYSAEPMGDGFGGGGGFGGGF